MSILQNVKPVLENVTNAISVILGTDIVICDDEGNYIALNETYLSRKGTQAYKPFIYGVIEGGVPIIVDNPGDHYLCKGCSNEGKCPQKIEVIVPFTYKERTIGYISAISFSEEMKLNILNRKTENIIFLEQMQGLIVKAVTEYDLTRKLNHTMNEMLTMMNSVNSGLISCNMDGKIINCNDVFLNQIKCLRDDIIGENLHQVFPNSHTVEYVLNNGINCEEHEYTYFKNGSNYKLVIAGRVIKNKDRNIEGAVFVVSRMTDIHKMIYNTQGKTIEYKPDDIIGVSEDIQELKRKIRTIAPSCSTVFIRGETGTGKELVARAIHALSQRCDKPFVAINCAAIPDSLLEGELFGYEDGSFTGGRSGGKAGKFEYANGGTIFLDEIGDMKLHLQAKILRTLQEKSVIRIGGCNPIKLDIRIISATHQDVESKIKLNEFREDLYYRLNVIPLSIPPLNKRKEDIIPLARFFMETYNKLANKNVQGISKEFSDALMQYCWPGNIRQLQNVIEYAIAFAESDELTFDNLSPIIKSFIKDKNDGREFNLENQVEDFEKELIMKAIRIYSDDPKGITKVIEILGISRSTFYRKAKKLGINDLIE